MVAGKSPGWLPPGWKERVKVTNGLKKKCYVEPLTRSKFYTKPQVAKYLKNKKILPVQLSIVNKPTIREFFGGETSLKPDVSCNMKTVEGASCASEQKERGEVVVERSIPDGLPTGWIKETKIQKRNGNGTRKDPYYTDPVSGYVFRSVPDALRYLKSGDISKCAIKPRKRHELSFLVEETSLKPPSAANMQDSVHPTTKTQSEGMENIVAIKGLEKRQYPTVSADATILSTAEHLCNHAIEECGETECSNDPSRSHQPRTESSKRKLCDRVDEKNGTDKFAVNLVGSTSDRKMLIDSRKINKQEAVNLPRRSSKRLMGTQPEMVVSLGLSERDLTAAARTAEAKLFRVCDKVNEKNGADQFAVNVVGSTSDRKMLINSRKTVKQEAVNLPCRSSKRLMGTQPETVVSLGLSERDLRAAARTAEAKLFWVCDKVNENNGADQFALNVVGSTGDRKMLINSRKTVKQEAVNLPRRSLKRLMGTKPEMVVSSGLSEQDLLAAARTAGEKLFRPCDRVNEKNGADQFAVNAVGSTSDLKVLINSRKTAKQEAVSLPRRSSKRLMGTKPEMVVSLGLSERDLIAAARNDEAKLVVRGAPQLLDTFSGAEIANNFLTAEAPVNAKLSNESNKPLKNEAFSESRQVTKEEHETDLESKILNPVGDSWLDPCLDFAIKILMGTIQIEEEPKETNDPSSLPLTRIDGCNRNQCDMICVENGTVSFPSADTAPKEEVAERGMEMKRSREMHINSSKSNNKEEVSLVHRFSNRPVGLNPGIALNYPLCQSVLGNAEYDESAAAKQSPEALDNVAHSAPQLFETIKGSKKPMADQAIQEDEPVRQETERKNMENPESQFLYPLEDSWPDSCIEFAVKTLTGELPIEDNIAIQDYFQQLDDRSYGLPDLGLPNSFQTDISSDFDSAGNPVRTQLPEIPTFLSPGNDGLMVHGDHALQQPILRGQEEQNQLKRKS